MEYKVTLLSPTGQQVEVIVEVEDEMDAYSAANDTMNSEVDYDLVSVEEV